MTDIVFVHGWPLSGATWRRVAEHLPEHRCHLLDLPGSPPSSFDERTDFSAAGFVSWIQAWVSQRGLTRYALVGHDSGAYFAQLVAAADPRVSTLVMSNTEVPRHRPPWVPFYQWAFGLPGSAQVLRTVLGSRAYLRSPAAFGGCYSDVRRIDDEFVRTFIEPLRTPRGIEGARRFLRAFDYSAVDALPEVHRRIRAPVHLIWGEDDPTFPVALLGDLTCTMPTLAGVRRLRGKLLVHDEQPAAYAAAIRNALTPERCAESPPPH
jgi:haloalkane dehalogenase